MNRAGHNVATAHGHVPRTLVAPQVLTQHQKQHWDTWGTSPTPWGSGQTQKLRQQSRKQHPVSVWTKVLLTHDLRTHMPETLHPI